MQDFFKVPKNGRSEARRRLVLGVGVNDADYMIEIRVGGKRLVCPAYRAWKHILRRCYCKKFLSENETYVGVEVAKEWHVFSNFLSWFESNYVPGYQIDKDLLTSSRIYGPDTCLYVPRWLNNLTEDHRKGRGEFKIGVCRAMDGVGFIAQCSDPSRSSAYIGTYKTEEEAYQAWMNRKKEVAFSLKSEMDKIDKRIYPRVIQIIEEIK